MNLGILCYASPTGLGYQTRDYVKYLNPKKLLAVDLSMYNHMPVYKDWYKDYETIWTYGQPTNDEIDRFLDDLDVVFMAETPLNYYLFEEATRRGIKTFNAYNYEFLDYFKHPEWAVPTVMAAPTVWNIDVVRDLLGESKVHHFPVPVILPETPRVITQTKTLGHIIGRPAVHDRNGTLSFLNMVEQLGHKYNYVVYVQEPKDYRAMEYYEAIKLRLCEMQARFGLKVISDIVDNKDLYAEMDLLVLPRRYGGLCLPMQEALSWGIPVVMTDISPNDYSLPKAWLAKSEQVNLFRGHAEIPIYAANINTLVQCVEQFNDPVFTIASNAQALSIAKLLSWEYLKPKYLKWFAEL